jgi:peptidoglycan hydrolase-like protein with peptidoglycan-binding domain
MIEKLKLILIIFLLWILITSTFGCATLGKNDLERQQLRNQVQALETQLKQKDEEITSLNAALNNQISEKEKLEKNVSKLETRPSEKITKPNTKQIQIALKNAGYDPGSVDGVMGEKTEEAIKAFQKANGLEVDGRIGSKTWDVLKELSK